MSLYNHKHPIYIELNGIPGTGKTTLANLLTEECRKIHLRVYNISDVYFLNEKHGNTEIITILKALMFSPNINIKALKVIIRYRLNREKIKYVLKLLKLNYQIIKTVNHDKDRADIIILDEGIIQYLLSFIHLDSIKDEISLQNLVNYIFKKIPQVYIFNCDLDIESVYYRVIQRNVQGHRFDSMPKKDLKSNLLKNLENLKIIRKCVDDDIVVKNIDTSRKTLHNAHYIMKEVKIIE